MYCYESHLPDKASLKSTRLAAGCAGTVPVHIDVSAADVTSSKPSRTRDLKHNDPGDGGDLFLGRSAFQQICKVCHKDGSIEKI